MAIKILTIFGTRPEAIKMAPVVKALKGDWVINKVCVTGQHTEMLTPVLDLFDIRPDFTLDVMLPNQTLAALTAKILVGLDTILQQFKPAIILVHGDTTTTFAASLAAYYHHIPVGHVEAGLRTGNLYSPWPEEANRCLTTTLTDLHFAPTACARDNLLAEGVPADKIYVTGNTVVDALLEGNRKIETQSALRKNLAQEFPFLNDSRRMILVTGHRRENFGQGLQNICEAIRQIASLFPKVDIVYPVHLNPCVQTPVHQHLEGLTNVHLIEPLGYLPFIYLMKRAYMILTDSGGIQEEAPSLGKPVLLMRDTSERPEAILSGAVQLVGANSQAIVENVSALLEDEAVYNHFRCMTNPYGAGDAAEKIVQALKEVFAEKSSAEHRSDSQPAMSKVVQQV
ncbi:MAG: UDP-N-acetylglucosamine 2-epimerase (non-hydrolyzing) [Legionella sp.]|nr:UDP-N-acetylglucosamine 2-epimerase (non-hydrolyzing) [Legionella sp.]